MHCEAQNRWHENAVTSRAASASTGSSECEPNNSVVICVAGCVQASALRETAREWPISVADWARVEQHLVVHERESTALDRANMNAWRLDGDDVGSDGQVSMTLSTSSKSGKRVFFGEDDDLEPVGRSSLASGGDGSATRRKKVGWGSELVIEDDMGDLEGAKMQKETLSERSDVKEASSRSAKVSETVTANVVESVVRPAATVRVATSEAISARCDGDADMEAFVHHLVRSHLLHHGHDDVVALLDSEKVSGWGAFICRMQRLIAMCDFLLKPCPALNTSTLEHLKQQVIPSGLTSSTISETTLEQFLRGERSRLTGMTSRRASKEVGEPSRLASRLSHRIAAMCLLYDDMARRVRAARASQLAVLLDGRSLY